MLTLADQLVAEKVVVTESTHPFLDATINNLVQRYDAVLIHGKANALSGNTSPERVRSWDKRFPPSKEDYDLLFPVKASVPREIWEQNFPPIEVDENYDLGESTFVRVGETSRQLVVSGPISFEILCQMGHRLAAEIFPKEKTGEHHMMVNGSGSTNEAILAVTENRYGSDSLVNSFGHRGGPNAEILLADDLSLPLENLLALRGYLPNMSAFRLLPPSGALEPVEIKWEDIPTPSDIYAYCAQLTEFGDQDDVRNAYLTLAIQNSLRSLLQVYLSGGISKEEELKWVDSVRDRTDFLKDKLSDPPRTVDYLLEPGLDVTRLYRASGSATSLFRLLSIDDPQITRMVSATGLVEILFGNPDWQSVETQNVIKQIEINTTNSIWRDLDPEGVVNVVAGRKQELLDLAKPQNTQTEQAV